MNFWKMWPKPSCFSRNKYHIECRVKIDETLPNITPTVDGHLNKFLKKALSVKSDNLFEISNAPIIRYISNSFGDSWDIFPIKSWQSVSRGLFRDFRHETEIVFVQKIISVNVGSELRKLHPTFPQPFAPSKQKYLSRFSKQTFVVAINLILILNLFSGAISSSFKTGNSHCGRTPINTAQSGAIRRSSH